MSSHFDSEPTATLDELYQYRGEQLGCAYRGARIVFFLITAAVGVFFLGTFAALLVYVTVARDLPSAGELKQRASTFNSTRILDRNGKLLYELDDPRSEEHTSELQSQFHLVCRLLLEKKKK